MADILDSLARSLWRHATTCTVGVASCATGLLGSGDGSRCGGGHFGTKVRQGAAGRCPDLLAQGDDRCELAAASGEHRTIGTVADEIGNGGFERQLRAHELADQFSAQASLRVKRRGRLPPLNCHFARYRYPICA